MLTGCDTVSYLYDIDRLQELQHLAKYGNHNESLNVQEYVLSSDYYIRLPTTAMTLKGISMRYEPSLVTLKYMRVLPSTEDAFQLHLRRALHQLVI